MDYKTKPLSRKQLRIFAMYFRELFGVPNTGAFPVLESLDKISDVFPNSNYEIVDDQELPPKTMACCQLNENSGIPITAEELALAEKIKRKFMLK